MSHRRTFLVRTLAAGVVVSIATFAAVLWQYRIELFVIPALWEEIGDLREESNRRPEDDTLRAEVASKLRTLIELQRSDLLPRNTRFSMAPAVAVDGRECAALWFDYEEGVRRVDHFDEAFGSETNVFAAIDTSGRLVGDPILVGHFHDHQYWRPIRDTKRGYDVFRLWSSFDVGFDSSGIIPFGFVLTVSEDNLSSSNVIPFSTGNSMDSEEWRRFVNSESVGLPWARSSMALDTVHAWLNSHRIGDRHRALYAIELLGKEFAHLAVQLIDDNDDFLRARAGVVAANDRTLGSTLVKMVERDSCSRVRHAVALALLCCNDDAVARQAFLYVWGLEDSGHSQFCFPLKRLSSPDVAGAILGRVQSRVQHDDVLPFLYALERADLAPHASTLLSLWAETSTEANSTLLTALAWCVARLDDERAVAISLRNLADPGDLSLSVLESLISADRTSNALIPALQEIAERIADPDRAVLAALVLQHWKTPKAAERLATRLLDPSHSWLEAELHSFSEFYHVEDVEKEMTLRNEWNAGGTVVDDSEPHPFSRYAPPGVVSTLLTAAASRNREQSELAFRVLRQLDEKILHDLANDLAASWRSAGERQTTEYTSVSLLAQLRYKWAEPIVFELIDREPRDRKLVASAIVKLFWMDKPRSTRWVSFLERLSQSEASEWRLQETRSFDAMGFDPDGFDVNGFDKDGFDKDGFDAKGYDVNGLDAEGFDADHFDRDAFGPDSSVDIRTLIERNIPLAATLLLVTWDVAGAKDQLFQRFRDRNNTWLDDELCMRLLPHWRLDARLEELAKSDPERYEARVEQLLAR